MWRHWKCNSRSCSSSVLSKHFILRFMTAHGNRLLLFVMQRQPSLKRKKKTRTLTRKARLLSGGPFGRLQPDRDRLIPPKTPFLHIIGYLECCSWLGTTSNKKEGDDTGEHKKKTRKRLRAMQYRFNMTYAENKHERCNKKLKPGYQPKGYPLDPVSPPKLLFSSTH